MTDFNARLAPSGCKLMEHALRQALSSGKNAIEAEHIALALASDARFEHRKLCDAYALIARHARDAGA